MLLQNIDLKGLNATSADKMGICREFAIASQRTGEKGTLIQSTVWRSTQSTPPLKVTLKLEDCPVEMEIDMGAALSLVLEATFEKL